MLLRQGMSLAYVKTAQGHEVDFLATAHDGRELLVHVASDLGKQETFEWEVRALLGAATEFPQAEKILIAESQPPRGSVIPIDVKMASGWRWLLHPAA